MMKISVLNYLTVLFLLFLSCSGGSESVIKNPGMNNNRIELVESIPAETNLDLPDIRNTADVWMEMIRGAKRTIDLEQFYVITKNGEPFDTVMMEIIRAAERGVAVRLIADSKMYKTYPALVDSLGKMKNITVRVIDFNKMTGGVQHAKFFIIDGEQVFMGSQNFDWRAVTHIHETGLRIRHPEIADFYSRIFELDWKMSEFNDIGMLNNHLSHYHPHWPVVFYDSRFDSVKLIPTASPRGWLPDTNSWDEPRILDLINNAEKELRIQFMVYGTHTRKEPDYRVLDDAIRRAAARGVKVRIVAADWIKGRAAEKDLKTLSLVPNVEMKISEIPDWSGGYISFARVEHCKFIVADSSSFWLGTSNAEKSYFYTSRNLGMIVMNKKLSEQLIRKFDHGWNGSYTEFIDPVKTYTPRKRGED